MASSRKTAKKSKSPPRRAAGTTRRAPVEDAEERLRAQLRQEQERAAAAAAARDEEEDDDEEDEEEDAGPALAVYDPSTHGVYSLATHSAVPNEHLSLLAQGGKQLRELVLSTSASLAKQQEGLFTGYSVNSQLASEQLRGAYEYGNAQRARADDLQQRLAEKDLEISHMVRQSEEATTERMRLKAEVERGSQALQRLQMEIDGKLQARQYELAAVQRAAAPVFGAVAQGITAAVQHYGLKAVAGGLPAAPGGAPQSATPGVPAQVASEFQVSDAGAAEWQAQVVAYLQALKTPRIAACLRAMLCSYALADQGAPPLPKSVSKERLFDLLVEELGQDAALSLLLSCREAYVVADPQQPPQQAANGAATAPN